MITAAELVAAIAGNIKIDNNATDVARLQVYRNINNSILYLLNHLPIELLGSECIKTVTFNLTINMPAYQWPSDYVRFKAMWLRYNATSSRREVRPLEKSESLEAAANLDLRATMEFPRVDLQTERGFTISPSPSANVTDGGRLRYIYKHPDVSASQNCLFDERWKTLIIERASGLCTLIEGQGKGLEMDWMKLFEDDFGKFVSKEI